MTGDAKELETTNSHRADYRVFDFSESCAQVPVSMGNSSGISVL